jgi:CRP/FNR family transcriptional regulator, anaerobic regulatory protein
MVVIQSPVAANSDAPGGPCALCGARRLSVCSALVDDGLNRLARIADDVALGPGAALMREGDPANHLFSITSGAVRVYKLLPDGRRQIVGFLYPGDFLGFGAGDRYAFSAEALEPVTACRFRKAEYSRLVRELPDLEGALLERAGSELAAAQEQMLLLGRKTAQERLASFLLDTSGRQHRAGGPPGRLRLAMTRAEIADYLGLTTETVSRITSRLKVSGLIRLLSLSEIAILRPDALQAIARGETGAEAAAG